jgi:hypothetical protein
MAMKILKSDYGSSLGELHPDDFLPKRDAHNSEDNNPLIDFGDNNLAEFDTFRQKSFQKEELKRFDRPSNEQSIPQDGTLNFIIL